MITTKFISSRSYRGDIGEEKKIMVVREMVLCGADGTQTFTRGCSRRVGDMRQGTCHAEG